MAPTPRWTVRSLTNLFELTAQGMTQAQIAKRLRRTPKAVERKVAKLRRNLASELRRESYLNMDFQSIVNRINAAPTLRTRVSALIAGNRI
jgi:IS30 family transposase